MLDGEKWIRVPSSRRTKSFSGVHSLVGSADQLAKTDAVQADRSVSDQGGVPQGEPAVEIESLIIPEIETMHTKLIEQAQTRAGAS